jgi:hypothetical protein
VVGRRAARIVFANLGGAVGLWLALLLVSSVVEDLYLLVKRRLPPEVDEALALPNYPDKQAARRLLLDFRELTEEYVPFVVWKRRPLRTENVNIGPDGWRVHRLGPENDAPDAAPAGFYGGSTIFGKGAPDDGTIPAVFDQLTRGWRVANYGQHGYTTRQMLALLVNQINTREMPRLVVFYDGFNHVFTHCNYGVTRLLNGHMAEEKLRRALQAGKQPRWGYAFDEILMPLVRRARRVIGAKRFVHDEFACASDPVRAEQVAENLVRNWEMARLLVEAWGGRFAAFLQPVAAIGHPRFDHLRLEQVGVAEQLRAVYPLIREKLAGRGRGWSADLSGAFDTDAYLYVDDVHVTRDGNEIIARRMLDFLTAPPR